VQTSTFPQVVAAGRARAGSVRYYATIHGYRCSYTYVGDTIALTLSWEASLDAGHCSAKPTKLERELAGAILRSAGQLAVRCGAGSVQISASRRDCDPWIVATIGGAK
jgi:hypothetical protein